MTGYSGKPVVQKLGIKPGFRIFAAGAPAAYPEIVGKLPVQVTILSRLTDGVDMVHVFAAKSAGLADKLRAYREAIAPDGMIWVSWPKKASGIAADLTENGIRDIALPLGLVDIKVCAVDAVWAGLKFVIPKAQRVKGDQRIKRPK